MSQDDEPRNPPRNPWKSAVFPLSSETRVEITFCGPLGPREFHRLIEIVRLMAEGFEEDKC